MATFCLALGLSQGLWACAPDGGPTSSTPGLRDVDIPAGFDFATTSLVRLTADVPLGTRLEVQLPGGAVIYRGPAPAGALELSVPTKDTTLQVITSHEGEASRQLITVEAGLAHLRVEG
jgi:hypothetical protein